MTGTEYLTEIRALQRDWGKTSVEERVKLLSCLRHVLVARTEEIVESICDWSAKVPTEALLGEIYPVLDLLHYYEKNAASILRRRTVPRHFSFPGSSAFYQYKPYGIAAIFSPWNLPFQLSVVPTLSALTAGNAVVLKPSEITPGIGALLLSLFREAGYPDGILNIVYGAKSEGQKLILDKPDIVFFTGGSENGKGVLKSAAENLIPVVLELGGKDPMIVFRDTPWERSLNAAVYGAFCNAGQVCMSVERLFVEHSIHDRFVEGLERKIKELKVGTGIGNDIGPMTTEMQADSVERQIREALSKGARAIPAFRREGRMIHPLVLTGVRPEMSVCNEETFGPVLPVLSFDSEEEAIKLANDSDYGLNASVWTNDLKKGQEIAARLDTGTCAVNDVIKNAGHPFLPFGGVKKSGFGRYHGPHGLWTFCRPVATLVNTGCNRTEVNWFPYSLDLHRHLLVLMRLFHSGSSKISEWVHAVPTFRYFRGFMK